MKKQNPAPVLPFVGLFFLLGLFMLPLGSFYLVGLYECLSSWWRNYTPAEVIEGMLTGEMLLVTAPGLFYVCFGFAFLVFDAVRVVLAFRSPAAGEERPSPPLQQARNESTRPANHAITQRGGVRQPPSS